MTRRGLFALLGLLLLAGASIWLAQRTPAPADTPAPPASEQPDYYFRDATLHRYDGAGPATMELRASDIRHFPDSGYSALTTINLTYYVEDGTRWLIRAAHGTLPDQGEVLQLEGDVRITRPDSTPPVQITAAQLAINMETRIANSDGPVTMQQGALRVAGTGLTAWLKTRQLQILDAVRGHYE